VHQEQDAKEQAHAQKKSREARTRVVPCKE
jgi:hypothetical protein